MNGYKAKQLRAASKFDLNIHRTMSNKENYRIEEHVKIIKGVKTVALQLWCRGPRVLYKKYKREYKNG